MVFKKKSRKHNKNQKFCPKCGTQAHAQDTYCTNCGYSFETRGKKQKRGVKWRRIILILIIILGAYIIYRYTNNQDIFPSSIADIFNISSNNAR